MRIRTYVIALLLATTAFAQESASHLAWARKFIDGPNVHIEDSVTLADGALVFVGSFTGLTTFAPGHATETTIASQGADIADGFVMCIEAGGDVAWYRIITSGGLAYVYGVSAFPDGSFGVTGTLSGTAVFQPGLPDEAAITAPANVHRMFLARYRRDGSLAWARPDGGNNGTGVAAFPDGSCVVVGDFTWTRTFGAGEENETVLSSTASSATLFVAKYAGDGGLVWARRATVEDGGLLARSRVAGFADGSVVVVGWHSHNDAVFGPGEPNETRLVFESAPGQGQQIFVARYGPEGALAWARAVGAENRRVQTSAVASAPDGSLRVVGWTNTGGVVFGRGEENETTLPVEQAGFFVSYRADGSLEWVRSAPNAFPWAAILAPDASVLTTGHMYANEVVFGPGEPGQVVFPYQTPRIETGWLAGHAPDGAFRWVVTMRGSGGTAHGRRVSLSGAALFVTGWMNGTATLGYGEPQETTLTTGATAGFVARYDFNGPPVVDAGANLTIPTSAQAATTIAGSATDPEGDDLTFRWFEGDLPLTDVTAVAAGACPLALGTLPALAIGDHVLRLEVSDPFTTVADTIVLTVENSPPVAAPAGGGVYEIGPLTHIPLGGQVADFDGDQLTYTWMHGEQELGFGTIAPPYGGAPVDLPVLEVDPAPLGPGTYDFCLVLDDGVNEAVTACVTAEVLEAEAPTMCLAASATILWPPNGQVVDVIVHAEVCAGGGESVTLSVEVTTEAGAPTNDAVVVSIDQATGNIHVQLRAAREGKGDGQTYVVTVTATDAAGNTGIASVNIVAPHDQRRR